MTSALEVIFNVMRSINPRFTYFYLLTYLSRGGIVAFLAVAVSGLLLSSLPELAGPGSDDAISVCLVPQISIHRS